jgi:thiamine kinase-like enzyme
VESCESKLQTYLQGEIRDKIERRWRTYFPARAGESSPQTVCGKIHVRGYSIVFEYRLKFSEPNRSEHIFAKIRRKQAFGSYDRKDLTDRALIRCQTEFEELSRAFDFFSARKDGMGVVRPLDYLDEYNAVLVESASGSDIGILIQERPQRLCDYLKRCGQWLRIFQNELHGVQQRTWKAAEFEANLLKRIDAVRNHGVAARTLQQISESILSRLNSIPSRDVPWSMLHGDYKPRHIWATPNAIQVIDFGNSHEGDCYRDVAAFLVELKLLSLIRPWFGAHSSDAHSEAFLAGYFNGGAVPAVLRLYMIEALLKKWERRLRRWSRNSFVLEVQRYLRRLKAAETVEALYLNRWFTARIEELSRP